MTWDPTRSAALKRLGAFLPVAGDSYATSRNFDEGPGKEMSVSGLSPYIARRILSEEEVFAAVVRQHGWQSAESFLQEVCWRTYWKGWLYLHPAIWHRYRSEVEGLHATMEEQAWASRYGEVIQGKSGIPCFDHWMDELANTGYLHNHARMWFASIWIFTLELPWQLGADLFYHHLLDADAASNTLSWRWVAGLQTKGKHYLATADNIQTFTHGRFHPIKELNEDAPALTENAADLHRRALPPAWSGADDTGASWLVTVEDLHGDDLWSWIPPPVSVAVLEPDAHEPASDLVNEFDAGAIQDFRHRLHVAQPGVREVPVVLSPHTVVAWAAQSGIDTLHVMDPGIGYSSDRLDQLVQPLASERIELIRHLRPWDRKLFPHATKGFFHFKKVLPDLAAAYG